MEGPSEARWAPDPYRRHELRYWDGAQWTEHVSEGDGSVLVDPPLPGPRTRREAAMASSVVSLTTRSVAFPTAARTPSPETFPAMSPAVIPAASAPTDTRVALPAEDRAPELFDDLPGRRRAVVDLPGGRRAAGAAGSVVPAAAGGRRADLPLGPGTPGGPAQTAPDDEPEAWDWRESHIPEILSGLGVAALIALAALLGGGGPGSSADAVQSVVTTRTGGAAPEGGAKASTTKKAGKKKSTVPGVQLSSANAPRITYRSSTSAAPRATTTSRTRTTSAPPTSSSTPPDETTTSSSSSSSSEPPSDGSSSTDADPPSTPSAEN